MKKRKCNLDEMQEQKLLKIEHTACWIGFFGLFAAIYVQLAIGNRGIQAIGGECVVILAMGIYIIAGCIRNGIWDRNLKPSAKTNGIISLISGLLFGGFWGVISYVRYHKLLGSLATFVVAFLMVAGMVLLLLTVLSDAYNRRKQHMDAEADAEEEK